MRKFGRTREKLAELLQKSFPDHNGLALTWKPDWLYAATGAYRSRGIDCYRWEGFGRHVRSDGTSFAVMSVGSYITMTELIKAKRLRISGSDEIFADD